MKKTLPAIVAAIALTGAAIAFSGPAEASRSGRALTYGLLGGIAAGALIGGAAQAYPPPPPAYYRPAPPPAYYPHCRKAWEQYWDGYQWRNRRIRVCD